MLVIFLSIERKKNSLLALHMRRFGEKNVLLSQLLTDFPSKRQVPVSTEIFPNIENT